MPKSKGQSMGLADCRSIRQVIKRERGLDAGNVSRELNNKRKDEPTMAEMDRHFDDLYNRLYGPNGLLSKGKPPAAAAKTNPMAQPAAA